MKGDARAYSDQNTCVLRKRITYNTTYTDRKVAKYSRQSKMLGKRPDTIPKEHILVRSSVLESL